VHQISGRIIILTIFGIGLALSAGAWWYHYMGGRHAAAFWGSPAGRLIVRGPEVTFHELGEANPEPSADATAPELIAGLPVVAKVDLSDEPGLIHLRHVFTQDANFQWDAREREPVAASDWAYAVRFGEGDTSVTVLFRRDFERIGKLDGEEVETLPSPRIGKPVRQYLGDIGALNTDAKPQAAGR
jgi:hypothetical protein